MGFGDLASRGADPPALVFILPLIFSRGSYLMGVSVAASGGLRRVLPFRTVVSTSTGLAYAAISLLGCVQLAGYMVGDSAWIALLVAGALALLAALCFSELNALYPSAAAIRQYISAAFTERASLTISFGYVLTIVTVIGADSYIVGKAITFAFPGTPVLLWILIILGLAAVANLLGIKIAGLLQDVTTYTLLVSLAVISLLALSKGGFRLHSPLAVGPVENFITAVALGVFIFSAFEWVTPLAEELNDSRQIPRGMLIAIGLLFVSYSLFTIACTNLIGNKALQAGDTPHVPQMVLGQATLGQAGVYWMLGATLLTAVMTFNGGFATASRFLYAAAREATLPRAFALLNGRLVPWFTVLLLAVASAAVAVVINQTQDTSIIVLVGAVLEAFIYAVAGLCVIQLRRRQRDAERSFLIPLGWVVPILTIVIFTVLGLLAGTTSGPLPLVITAALFVVSFLYVVTVVPRLKANAEARRQALGSRRPRRPAAATESDSPS
jgi:amino acid transporter